jgi:hypothetical protein
LPAAKSQQLRPGLLGVADAHRVGILHGLLRQQRDVRTAQHHRDGARTIVPGELVAARRAAGDDGDADEVGREIGRHVGDALVVEREFRVELRRRQCGERGQGQRLVAQRLLEDAAAVAVERPLGRQQGDLHGALAPMSAS